MTERRKIAFITGITGQDGAYLSEFLLEKGYEVHGLRRRASSHNTGRIDHLLQDLENQQSHFMLHYGDMCDSGNLTRLVYEIAPDEIYNLAAQSHVQVSFDSPEYTANVDGLGTLRLLEAMRLFQDKKPVRFYQASSSELYGNAGIIPQNEQTPFAPRSPYAAAKLYAYWLVRNYREAYGLHASNGILFNHESPLRGEDFVTRKITRGVAGIVTGACDHILLGNLDAQRDWGHARDYVRGMWQMLQHDKADDYVLASGQTRSVRDFVSRAFACADIDIEWTGRGLDEVARHAKTGAILVRVDKAYFRPLEVHVLEGDASKARKDFGWVPQISFDEMVCDMVQHDIALLRGAAV